MAGKRTPAAAVPRGQRARLEAVLVVAVGIAAYLFLHSRCPAFAGLPRPPLALALLTVIVAVVAGGLAGVWLYRRRFVRRVTSAFGDLRLQNRASTKPRLRKVGREGRDLWQLGFTMPVGIDSMTMHLKASYFIKSKARVEAGKKE